MKLSKANQTKLYAAIHEPIMDMRIEYVKALTAESLDDDLFRLNKAIWQRVHTALNLDTPL